MFVPWLAPHQLLMTAGIQQKLGRSHHVPWLAPHQQLMTASIQQKLGRSHHVCSLAGSSPTADDSWYTTKAGEEPPCLFPGWLLTNS